jgi:DnaK suppressor protein
MRDIFLLSFLIQVAWKIIRLSESIENMLYERDWVVIMDEAQLKVFRDLLLQQKDDILKSADLTVSDMNDNTVNYPDPTDRASIESDRSFALRLRERERMLLGKINEALERIESGDFGICESCGNDISLKRLEARPVTTLCIDCKKKAEALEKARGE